MQIQDYRQWDRIWAIKFLLLNNFPHLDSIKEEAEEETSIEDEAEEEPLRLLKKMQRVKYVSNGDTQHLNVIVALTYHLLLQMSLLNLHLHLNLIRH
jgi:hypothetical protein